MTLEERIEALENKVEEIEIKANFHITELYRLLKIGDDNNTNHINAVQEDLAGHIQKIQGILVSFKNSINL